MTSPNENRDPSLEARLKQLLEQAAVEQDSTRLLALTSEINRLVDEEQKNKKGTGKDAA